MSKLANSLAAIETPPAPLRRGPANACHPLYGHGDLEDWQAVESLRAQGFTWAEVQRTVDEQLGIKRPLVNDKFRYHWRRRCFCWSEQDRR